MKPITEMIRCLTELNETGAISYSAFKELISLAREAQMEVAAR